MFWKCWLGLKPQGRRNVRGPDEGSSQYFGRLVNPIPIRGVMVDYELQYNLVPTKTFDIPAALSPPSSFILATFSLGLSVCILSFTNTRQRQGMIS